MFLVLIPTGFESNLFPEQRGKFFAVWASVDTRQEAEGIARLVPGAKVEERAGRHS